MKPLKEDWVQVRGLAVDIANAEGRGDTRLCEDKRRTLLRTLNLLQRRHGPHPSIIATKADYLLRNADKIKALRQALKLAQKLGDKTNIALINNDLRELQPTAPPHTQNAKSR